MVTNVKALGPNYSAQDLQMVPMLYHDVKGSLERISIVGQGFIHGHPTQKYYSSTLVPFYFLDYGKGPHTHSCCAKHTSSAHILNQSACLVHRDKNSF